MASSFGKLQENLYQSDLIRIRKALNNKCSNKKAIINNRCLSNVNHSNLIYGLYSKMDLTDVCTIGTNIGCTADCSPCKIDDNSYQWCKINTSSTQPFYYNNTIDPVGELFGKSQCGELNYTHYMLYFPNC